jgi:hypothetical protein
MNYEKKELTKTMQVLLFAEENEEIDLYDVEWLFDYEITSNYASQLLSRNRKNNLLKKRSIKYQEHKRRGRIFIYTLSEKGKKRCEWLHSLGF